MCCNYELYWYFLNESFEKGSDVFISKKKGKKTAYNDEALLLKILL